MHLVSQPYKNQIKAVSHEQGVIEGYASLYDVEDSDQDIIAKGAFDESLQQWRSMGQMPPMLWQHDVAQPIGIWTSLKSDSRGLFVRGQLFVDEVERAAEAYALLKRGALSGLSIGYKAERVRRVSKEDGAQPIQRGVRVIERLKLFEISLVTFPALETARISSVKSAARASATINEQHSLIAQLRGLTHKLRELTPDCYGRN
jgi:HK97 family phage prohead protease